MRIAIEKMIYGPDGLGRMPADEQGRGKAVFVPFVLPGEDVDALLTEERPGFARAVLEQVVKPSPHRTEPSCPYFYECGGCHYQHATYEEQLRIKKAVLTETVQRMGKLTLDSEIEVHSAEPLHYRNRTRMKFREVPDLALGYHKLNSNELLPVRECPISSPLINRGVAAVWQVAPSVKGTDKLREIQFFANHDDTAMLVEFYADRDADPRRLKAFAEGLRKAIPQIVGVTVFLSGADAEGENERAPLTVTRQGVESVSFGADSLEYHVNTEVYNVRAGAFFQTNRFLADELVKVAVGAASGRTVLDLYAGGGLFSLPLSRKFERGVAVEISPFSFADLKKNAPMNVKAVQATTEQYLERTGHKLKLDLVVVDPPRAGLGEKTARALGKLNTPRVTYVSCDPATLSRDLKVLVESGFRVDSAHLVDLFPQTFHMESVFHLVR